MNKNIFASVITAAVLAIGAVTPAYATPVTWTLSNVVFADGAKATGSFVYDADTQTISTSSIAVTAGTLSAYTYNMKGLVNAVAPNTILILNNFGDAVSRYLDLQTVSALTNNGGIMALVTGTTTLSYECNNCSIVRYITSGSLQAGSTNIPEPATFGLLGLGLAAMAWRRRKAS